MFFQKAKLRFRLIHTYCLLIPDHILIAFWALLPQVDENKPSKYRIGVHSGVCIHNGIVHKNGDEWTVDDCTECTCRVRTTPPLPHTPPHIGRHT